MTPQRIARFLINDLKGILKRHHLSMNEFAQIVPPLALAYLLTAEANGRCNRQQTRAIINEYLTLPHNRTA